MKQVTLNVPEDKYPFFMQLMRSLNFVRVEDDSAEAKLTPAQQETWKTIKAGFDELNAVEAGSKKARPVEDLFKELGI